MWPFVASRPRSHQNHHSLTVLSKTSSVLLLLQNQLEKSPNVMLVDFRSGENDCIKVAMSAAAV